MDKSLRYYKKKVDFYRSLQEKVPFLEEYGYMQERYYYNASESSTEYKYFNAICENIYEYIQKYLKILDYNDIEGIFSYFIFLLNRKYLAYDTKKEFDFNSLNFNELPILSPLAFNSHGKCRHIASCLRDLLSKLSHDAYILAGARTSKKDLPPAASTKLSANHAIVVASDELYTYLLDPSKSEIYFTDDEKTLYSTNCAQFDITNSQKTSYGNKIFFDLKTKNTYKPPYEIIASIENHLKILEENIDVADSFYKDIRPILEEAESIYQKILKITST